MILSEKEIRRYSQNAVSPLIHPFIEEHLQAASYDISMSGNISVLKRIGKVIDTRDNRSLDEMYENIQIGDSGYIFSPGEYILVELAEKVNVPETLVAHIRPRTRFTRAGILVADQHCNPTYEGKLYIGLYNVGPNAVLLYPGLQIAQFVFEELSSKPSESKWYKNKKNAAFQKEDSFRGAKFGEAGWTDKEERLYRKVLSSLEEEE